MNHTVFEETHDGPEVDCGRCHPLACEACSGEGRLPNGERCDLCERYESDTAAAGAEKP